QEIADIGVFMVSPKTSYMTGATLDVTGGMLMR
ncbi:3-oxoacyl-ACP reductase, partial [Klebsiella pneumoniae]|nr:3-oxoacyl-ACP reductase [Klebsiella pneumoniae]